MSSRYAVRFLALLTIAVAPIQTAFSQARGGTPTPPPAAGSSGAASSTGVGVTAPTRLPTTNIPSTTPTPTTTSRPPILFITGRVTQEDGTAPPEPATIERVCAGSTKAEGYTDTRGYFAIEVGNENGVFQDASETGTYTSTAPLSTNSGGALGGLSRAGGAMSDQRYSMCDLRARLAGFRSQVVSLANRRPMDDPNIGVILLHREGKEEGNIVSAISLAAPRDARHAFDKGLQAAKKNKTEDAEKEFRKAVTVYPRFAAAWNELGRIQMERGDKDAAKHAFETAVTADPKFVTPYLELSILAMQARDWKAVADITATALRLDAFDYPQAFLFNGVANYNLRHLDAAEKSLRQAEKLDTRHVLVETPHLLGLIFAQRQDYAAAAEQFRAYLKRAPDGEDAPKVRAQLAAAERMMASAGPRPDR